ncbi:hypothetical protein JOC75_000386 [Metabacillus crassostreae]|uniref:hypothetical protein n=1 Tax=Metabacillus crassostreae TaxID=929098 RepID=UPI00195CFFC1|nr:hypothetical protein [Metabacillus crassostreae]MBM7602416.1 hypothetical protein [Metabacillus crassostreae]
MNTQRLNMFIILTLLIGVPLFLLTPSIEMPLILEYILLPIGIVLSLIGIASSNLLIPLK